MRRRVGKVKCYDMEALSKLFGNPVRLKLLRLFFFNDENAYTADEAAFRTKAPKAAARRELNLLIAAGVVKKKPAKKGEKAVFAADKKFPHFFALQNFLRDSMDVSDNKIQTTIKRAGTLRVVVVSGIFTGAIETKVDVLVVGDKLEEKALASAIHTLEAELGRELRYAYFTTEEFKYRVGVYDRLVRDVFDYPHRTLLDRTGSLK